MERIFTKDIGRFNKGDSRNYPKPVWENIAKSAKQALTDITISVDELKELQNSPDELKEPQDSSEKDEGNKDDGKSEGTTSRGPSKGAASNNK